MLELAEVVHAEQQSARTERDFPPSKSGNQLNVISILDAVKAQGAIVL